MSRDIHPDHREKCNKLGYPTRQEAIDDAVRMYADARRRRSPTYIRGRLTPYLCPWCDQYHLTSRSGSKDKRLKRSYRNQAKRIRRGRDHDRRR